MNDLQLHDSDEDLKKQDLVLSELEASLIAHTIIFQKIYQLPRSRWTALTDKIINVPIQVESINNTATDTRPSRFGWSCIEKKNDFKGYTQETTHKPRKAV